MTVDLTTGEIVDRLSQDDAKRLTERIRLTLGAMLDQRDKVLGLIREAREGQAYTALGYPSWTAYVADEFSESLPRLTRDERTAVAVELAEMGMSTRAIGPVVGVNNATVSRDLRRVADATPQTPEPADLGEGASQVGSGQTPQGEDAGATTGATGTQCADPAGLASPPRPAVTGLDGKTYAPKPRPVRSAPEPADEWTDQDRAEELAGNLARNLSLLYAVTNPERRAEYITTWSQGIRSRPVLGQNFVTPTHMRTLASALTDLAVEWERAHV